MKFRYYLRGAGVGIIVTTIILMIAFRNYKPTLSADEIIEEAKKLGMVMSDDKDNNYIKDDSSDEDVPDGEVNNSSGEENNSPSGDETSSEDETPSEDEKEATEGNSEQESYEEETGSTTERSMVLLTINGGDTSKIVSEKLLALGVISNAEEFDKWLCVTKGLGDSILCGEFQIPEDASFEEIAKIITTK